MKNYIQFMIAVVEQFDIVKNVCVNEDNRSET